MPTLPVTQTCWSEEHHTQHLSTHLKYPSLAASFPGPSRDSSSTSHSCPDITHSLTPDAWHLLAHYHYHHLPFCSSTRAPSALPSPWLFDLDTLPATNLAPSDTLLQSLKQVPLWWPHPALTLRDSLELPVPVPWISSLSWFCLAGSSPFGAGSCVS